MKLKLIWQTLINLELPSGRASLAEEVAIALPGECVNVLGGWEESSPENAEGEMEKQ